MMSLFWYYRPEHTQGGRNPSAHSEVRDSPSGGLLSLCIRIWSVSRLSQGRNGAPGPVWCRLTTFVCRVQQNEGDGGGGGRRGSMLLCIS